MLIIGCEQEYSEFTIFSNFAARKLLQDIVIRDTCVLTYCERKIRRYLRHLRVDLLQKKDTGISKMVSAIGLLNIIAV